MLTTTGFFCAAQNSTDSVYIGFDSVYTGSGPAYTGTDSVYTGAMDSVKAINVIAREPNGPGKAGLAKAIETGTIYNSTSPYHNDLHEFTYLVVMWDYCNKRLLQMRTNGEVNKQLSDKLEKELSNAKAKATASKYDGLKIEQDYNEIFLKQIAVPFKD